MKDLLTNAISVISFDFAIQRIKGMLQSQSAPARSTLGRLGEPDLGNQKTGRDADKNAGDDVADEMPVPPDQQDRPNQQQPGKRQDAGWITPHVHTGEGACENHVARGKAAVRGAPQEMERMVGSVQHSAGIRHPEDDLQQVSVDFVGADGCQARQRGRLLKGRQASARDPDDHQHQDACGFATEKNDAGEPRSKACGRTPKLFDAERYRHVDVDERRHREERARKQRQEPHPEGKA